MAYFAFYKEKKGQFLTKARDDFNASTSLFMKVKISILLLNY